MEDQKKLEERIKKVEIALETIAKSFRRIAKSFETVIERQNIYGARVIQLDKDMETAMEVINEVIEGANKREEREPDLRMFG